MANPFVSEIRMFPFNFAPKGWAFCDGQLLPISQNTAVFSLLGTNFGGDGKSTFALPNLQGSVPMNFGQGPGLSLYSIGQTGGMETETLLATEMPAGHTHAAMGVVSAGNSSSPTGHAVAGGAAGRAATNLYAVGASTPALGTFNSLGTAGGNQPHNNMQPYLVLNFCIAMQGVYPPRS